MVICGGFVNQYRDGIICHDHWDRRGLLFSLSIRNGYDITNRFLKWLFVVALYINTVVASFATITVIEGSFIFSLIMGIGTILHIGFYHGYLWWLCTSIQRLHHLP